MFFQAINQMITAGTDLSINIRRVNNNLTVAVVPRRSGVKDGERVIPLILNGTPEELDAGFLQAVGTPVQKAQGILTNLEAFEKQAEQAASQSKAARSAAEKESKEVREKREKMEKLLKKAEDAMTGKRYSEALTWLKQAKILALPDKQKEIDVKMAEVQKKASEGSRQCPSRSRLHNRRHRNRRQPRHRNTEAESKSRCFCPSSRLRFRNPFHNRNRPGRLHIQDSKHHLPDSRKHNPYNILFPHHKRNRSRNRQFHNRKESNSINRYRCHSHGMHRYRRPQELMRSVNTSGNRKRLQCTTSTRTARMTGNCSGKTRTRNIRTSRRNAA